MNWLVVSALLVLVGCQTQPTKVSEVQVRQFDVLIDKTSKPLQLSDQTVVLDARSGFDYGLNRISGAIHFPWTNLAENPSSSGEVLRDLRKAALRLSLNGLEPKTPIVVVGYSIPAGGTGEAGRLAWNLLLLGFHDVQVANVEVFRKTLTQNPSPPAKNAPIWKIEEREDLQISPEQFAKLAQDPKGRLESRTFIIDVRSDKEYLNKISHKRGHAPDINAINIEWQEFYTPQGRPDARVKEKLKAVGILPNDRIILISQKGVRSGAAAYALLALGFRNVQNFSAGWNSLLKL